MHLSKQQEHTTEVDRRPGACHGLPFFSSSLPTQHTTHRRKMNWGWLGTNFNYQDRFYLHLNSKRNPPRTKREGHWGDINDINGLIFRSSGGIIGFTGFIYIDINYSSSIFKRQQTYHCSREYRYGSTDEGEFIFNWIMNECCCVAKAGAGALALDRRT